MSSYTIGFPRIGEKRELKFALESFWSGKSSYEELTQRAKSLRVKHLNYQKEAGIDLISINDFSLYDNMLDLAITLGAIPARFKDLSDNELYFSMARGNKNCVAMEMTKWFNTNYHYIVPELTPKDEYKLNASKIINEYKEAKELGIKPKVNIIGPITFLALSKRVDRGDTYELLGKILPIYEELLKEISKLDTDILVQIDEPHFVRELEPKELSLIKPTYDKLASVSSNLKIVVATYFEHSCEATKILVNTPIYALALDFVFGKENLNTLEIIANKNKKLFAGVVDGRNIWVNNIEKSLQILEDIAKVIKKEDIFIGSSCSLLHTPFTLEYEEKLSKEIKSWLSFAKEKLGEIKVIEEIFRNTKSALDNQLNKLLKQNLEANKTRLSANTIHDKDVQNRVNSNFKHQRDDKYEDRIKIQRQALQYPTLPTTTIGSFPQTPEIREARRDYKKGEITQAKYESVMKAYIDDCIAFQEEAGIDVLVHGEPERNDMVEYFGEQLKGFAFTQNGWVQSYGSRCVKPPIIYGDVSRPKPMTVSWITYAQSKTDKIMKGMLTGPVTILNWSFVRDDLPRSEVSKQIALAIADEISDLQDAGIKIIQVDEAAFKEGYPLRVSKIADYEEWAVRDFKISIAPANAKTQIHTHMCYSEFNDIIRTIEAMDADVISIETAKSGNELLKIFAKVGYKQEVGPGVYDIHSPRVPSVEEIVVQIEKLLNVLPAKQLWINPDCGLKTRKWEEVKPSLTNMVEAVKIIREK
jgi:5-methyltetrahydropteroyltriglutamate--homocysteine methyltransferase